MAAALQDALERSLRRLEQARAIAETLRDDPDMHRLAMKAVFVIDDCCFELDQAREAMRPEASRRHVGIASQTS